MGSFEKKRDRARRWEIAVATWARDVRGYYVLPTYDFSGKDDDKAPKILAPKGVYDLVAPDLLVWAGKYPKWLEVKWKERAVEYRRTRTLTTGINNRLWEHYCEVQRILDIPVHVLFVHDHERECRGDTVTNLQKYIDHQYGGLKMGPSGMVFWPYQKIPRWFGIEEIAKFLPKDNDPSMTVWGGQDALATA